MPQDALTQLSLVVVLGSVAHWVAWRARLPSILLLLLTGFVAGPILNWVHPDQLFGSLLMPFVSLSVALILFEGGLSLKFSELRGVGGVIATLVTVGALVTWIIATLSARWILGLEWRMAIMLGAILVLTGPTVVLPMLRYLRPTGQVGAILKWEGIVIDPIGALLAVLVFEVIITGELSHAPAHVALTVARTVVVGGVIGLIAAHGLAIALRRFWIADHLQTTVALMFIAGTFALSDWIQPESGLLTATILGVALTNQTRADIRAIAEFKENLQTVLLSLLFVLLSARLSLADVTAAGLPALLFVAVLIVIARPLCVLVSTVGSTLSWREKLFLSWMAPRGIVAAAVASTFGLALESHGFAQARMLMPVAFATIVGTVLFYGLTAAPVAAALGVADPDPRGVLLVGAGRFPRALAKFLGELRIRCLLVDTNRDLVYLARRAGLDAVQANVLTATGLERVDFGGIGTALAVTPSHSVNLLVAERIGRLLGRAHMYVVAPSVERAGGSAGAAHCRFAFSHGATFELLDDWCEHGARIVQHTIPADARPSAPPAFEEGVRAPLLVIDAKRRIQFLAPNEAGTPKPGDTIVMLERVPRTDAADVLADTRA